MSITVLLASIPIKRIVGFTGAAVLGLAGLACSTSVTAQRIPEARTITIDEHGNGFVTGGGSPIILHGVMSPDPGPGGQSSALTYELPEGFFVTAGDVFLTDADHDNATLDVIRFNQPEGLFPGSIVFYSDASDGADALADSVPIASFYTNTVKSPETGGEGANGATYTPIPNVNTLGNNQPGFVPGFAVTYNFISDGMAAEPAPEPATWAMMLVGFGGIGLAMRRLRRCQQTLP